MLSGTLIDRYVSEAPGVESEVAILEVDGDRIELLAPTKHHFTNCPIYKTKGKGVHHVAYRVDDLDVALEELKTRHSNVRAYASNE